MTNFLRKAFRKKKFWTLAVISAALLAGPAAALAQTDEIQVYDASIADVGKFNIMLHDNFTPDGRKMPDFPGAIVPNLSWNGVAEWAYGVTPWMEQGLYLPLYSFSSNHGATLNGFKLRELFVRPHSDSHTFFYGINFEFSFNAHYWEQSRNSSEVRPIIGLHLHPVDLIVNPIFDSDFSRLGNLEFVPSARVAYNFSEKYALAAEWYADFGPVHKFLPTDQQSHELWAVMNRKSKVISIETGIGFGVTSGADKITLKFMMSRDLN